MNKRNFGRVIKRIEKHPELHEQGTDPVPQYQKCGSPYCFIGHAEHIRTRGKAIMPISGFILDKDSWREDDELPKWLGLSHEEITRIYWHTTATVADFKRWHKKGSVS